MRHGASVDLVALRAGCSHLHGGQSVVHEREQLGVDRILGIVGRRGVFRALQGFRHRNGTEAVRQVLVHPGLQDFRNGDLVCVRAVTGHVVRTLRVQIDDLLEVRERASIQVTPGSVRRFVPELVAGLVRILV